MIAARGNGFKRKTRREIVERTVRAYQDWMAKFAEMTDLDVWYTHADVDAIAGFAPDLVVVATGSRPRPFLQVLDGLDPKVSRLQARDVIAEPALVPNGAAVTIIGAGMVGIEVADILLARDCRMTIVEIGPAVAPAMARNNRTDIMLRLKAGGVKVMVAAQTRGASGHELLLHTQEGDIRIGAGDVVIEAIGPMPDRAVTPMLDQAGVDYVLVGDCSEPGGDFMTAIRDGFMAAWSLQTRFGHAKTR